MAGTVYPLLEIMSGTWKWMVSDIIIYWIPGPASPARSDVAGVTIVTKDGFLSDALSTACFVLGSEEGQKLLEKYDVEGLFIDHAGTITMTEGMRAIFPFVEFSEIVYSKYSQP